jgi:hypothetical protein
MARPVYNIEYKLGIMYNSSSMIARIIVPEQKCKAVQIGTGYIL